MPEKVLMKGNEAFAEAAIRSGCRYYFGYPITPQNELTEYMSRKMPQIGGEFIQAESELASISMAYGATCAGGRVMVSSSSPGIALMQEGMSFLCSAQLPMVLINVSRGGPGVGCIQPGQADYYQATRGGGNGDYHVFVYAPSSIQEAVDLIGKAFDVADSYRNPVMILADGMLGQMMEPVVLPDQIEPMGKKEIEISKPWAITGHKNRREHNVIQSLSLVPEELEARINGYWTKYEKAKTELPEYEEVGLSDAEIVFVAYGSTARIVYEAMEELKSFGIRAGLIRPVTLWPFPELAFEKIGAKTKAVVSVELSQGQMIDDVLISAKGRWPVSLIKRTGGMLLTPSEVVDAAKNIMGEMSA